MEPIWLAFICGIVIGVILGGLSMGLFTLKQMEKNLAVGNVETVASRLRDDIKASGANHIMLNIQAGSSTLAQAKRTMDALPKIRARIAGDLG